ncbi:nitrite reductase small subunit NirD [Paenibacillus silvae]|uniref:nitrite reductase small subunit NirD n=1 Tax=Paenibacillus silvae TaxID=1325358 RepID=UPI0011A63913|nr:MULTISPECIES: nitrite reductase small subunit NirD [Paenibacillus]MCK6075331.1 nitrite reductase small subunit NirD [Paenibacillus silvae]MCK6149718.1 nitrite reductase small subunit NirD [Paenibacillus silvae]MCK6268016.1 nitrite reductase small subunit NirD [Paenibacillus silvae]
MTTKQTGTYFPAGPVDEFLPRIGRVVEIEHQQLAVFRTSDGTIFAAENHNPHPKGGPLAEGIVSGNYLYDPLYDWKIDLTTGQVQAPDNGQVKMFPVKVENDQVWIAV